MQSSPESLPGQLAGKPLRPAYLISGPEPLRVLEAADAVRAEARKQGIADREVFAPEGQREPDWDALAATFAAPGLFSTRRLVELRLPTGRPGKAGEKVLLEFCEAPPDDVCLLVTCDDWSKKHGGRWSEAIARIGVAVVAWTIKPHELPDWIDRRLGERGLRADRAAVQRLAERVEGNLLAAAQEIDKLVLLGGGDGRLDVERMDALVADAARYDVFRLVDAALNGNAAQVSRMLRGLRAEGGAVLALLGMVTMELQRAAALARVQARGGNLGAEFKAQRIWDSKQATYRRALQRHPASRWERLLVEVGKVDRIAKGRQRAGSEPVDAWQQLERMLLAVAEPRALAMLG